MWTEMNNEKIEVFKIYCFIILTGHYYKKKKQDLCRPQLKMIVVQSKSVGNTE